MFFSLLLGPLPHNNYGAPVFVVVVVTGQRLMVILFDIILLWSGSNGHLFDIILLWSGSTGHLFDIILLWSEVNGHLFDIILLVRSCCALENSLGVVRWFWGGWLVVGGGYNNQRGHSLGFYNREETKKRVCAMVVARGGVTTTHRAPV